MRPLILIVIAVLLVYFLFPTLIKLCDSFGEEFATVVQDIKDAFTDKAVEWIELFLRFF